MKFRGKRKDNGEWVEGFYCEFQDYGEISYCIRDYKYDIWDEVIPESVGMSTLQKDKNGVEIFGSIPINGKMSKGSDALIDEVGDTTFVMWNSNYSSFCYSYCQYIGLGNANGMEIIGKQYEAKQ